MRSIRIFAKKNMGDPYYEPTIMVHDSSTFDRYRAGMGRPLGARLFIRCIYIIVHA